MGYQELGSEGCFVRLFRGCSIPQYGVLTLEQTTSWVPFTRCVLFVYRSSTSPWCHESEKEVIYRYSERGSRIRDECSHWAFFLPSQFALVFCSAILMLYPFIPCDVTRPL